jgi:hypothetical protein
MPTSARNLPADEGSGARDIWLLRLRALLAQARGDDVAYRDLVNRPMTAPNTPPATKCTKTAPSDGSDELMRSARL